MRLVRVLVLAALLAVAVAVPGQPASGEEFTCVIEPRDVVTISTPVAGLVERVNVERGDLVTEGQVLAVLESTVKRAELAAIEARTRLEARIKSSEARRAFGERRLKRTEELFKQDMVPLREMDEAETSKLLAETELEEALEARRLAELERDRVAAELGMRTIRSPITGVVVERYLSAGELAGQGPLFKVAQIDPLRVEAFVPPTVVGRVAVGQEAQVIPDALGNNAYAARIVIVDRVGDAATATFGMRLELPNPGYRLPAGIKCRVRLSP